MPATKKFLFVKQNWRIPFINMIANVLDYIVSVYLQSLIHNETQSIISTESLVVDSSEVHNTELALSILDQNDTNSTFWSLKRALCQKCSKFWFLSFFFYLLPSLCSLLTHVTDSTAKKLGKCWRKHTWKWLGTLSLVCNPPRAWKLVSYIKWESKIDMTLPQMIPEFRKQQPDDEATKLWRYPAILLM